MTLRKLERTVVIVNTFTDPLLALNHFSAGLFDMVVLEKICKMQLNNPESLIEKIIKLEYVF